MSKRTRYSPEHLEFLRHGYLSMNVRGLTTAFNARFGSDRSEVQIKSALRNHRITCGRAQKDRLVQRRRILTEAQEEFLKNNYVNWSVVELTRMLNSRFNTHKTAEQIKAFVFNHSIKSGRSGCFEKGHTPWNNGTKGQGLTGANPGSFKIGDAPPNRKPLGSTRIDKNGCVLIKIAERNPYTGSPTRYKSKQVHLWEQANGPVPDGFVVMLRDGDKSNIETDNLMLVSRQELLSLNQCGYKDTPVELKPSVLALVKLKVKTFDLAKKPGSVPEERSK